MVSPCSRFNNWLIFCFRTCYVKPFSDLNSGESGLDIVWSWLFTHSAHNRTLLMTDAFSPTGNSPFGLGSWVESARMHEAGHDAKIMLQKSQCENNWVSCCYLDLSDDFSVGPYRHMFPNHFMSPVRHFCWCLHINDPSSSPSDVCILPLSCQLHDRNVINMPTRLLWIPQTVTCSWTQLDIPRTLFSGAGREKSV